MKIILRKCMREKMYKNRTKMYKNIHCELTPLRMLAVAFICKGVLRLCLRLHRTYVRTYVHTQVLTGSKLLSVGI